MRAKNKLVCGFGINDAEYPVQPMINGVQVVCPIYHTWHSMIKRCYSSKYHTSGPTYIECTVCKEWRSFKAFRAWAETQDYTGKQLDKDLLTLGNEVYSPDTCMFVPSRVNSFICDCGASRGKYLIGVHLKIETGRYAAQISLRGKSKIHLGYFTTEIEAHHAWARAKRNRAYELASEQTDERVAQALRNFGDHVVANADSLLRGDSQRTTASA